MRKYAFIFTAYAWDAFNEKQYRRNARNVMSGDMYVIADESHGSIITPTDVHRLSVSEAAAREAGLLIRYKKALFWDNIDYLYILFFDKYPDYEYFVFIDYDAIVDCDVDDLVARVESGGVDFVGEPSAGPNEEWVFRKSHLPMYPDAVLEARISATTILSRKALDHISRRRRALSSQYAGVDDAFWPFCEAFVPSELKIAGFKLARLADYHPVDRFAWWPPTLDDTLVTTGRSGFIHPVLDRPRYIRSMLRHSKTIEFLSPRGALWTAARRNRGLDWITPWLAESVRRIVRVLTTARRRVA